MMNIEEIIKLVTELAITYSPKIFGAAFIAFIGFWLIGKVTKMLAKMLEKQKIDDSLRPFLVSLTNMTLKVLLVLSIFNVLGIQMTSFIAILGAAGLAVGMALSGTLQNFAGGVIILIIKPFKVGDVIQAQGFTGVVKEIQIFNTILKTPDNKTIVIPNGGLSNASLTNFSTEPFRRVDLTVGVGYGDSTEKTRAVLNDIIAKDDRILQEPAPPFIALAELADSSINFTVRLWVKSSDYWGVTFDMNEKIYNRFNEEGLNIPFPQMDVHIHKND